MRVQSLVSDGDFVTGVTVLGQAGARDHAAGLIVPHASSEPTATVMRTPPRVRAGGERGHADDDDELDYVWKKSHSFI